MRKHNRRIVLASGMVAAMALVSFAQTETRYEELPRFHRVNDQLYRGAQPKAEGIRKLAALGIKTIVNLRREDDHTLPEAAAARALGLRYFHVPMRDMSRPTDEQVSRALAIINSPENQPVFVHCRRGADRTGVVIACYRIAHDGWTRKDATKEAKHYGMSWTQFGMKDYIEDFYERQQKRATGTSK
jgi:uncharacterized protein (TIGR01244 family)